MSMTTHRRIIIAMPAAMLSMLLTLTACGGGGDDGAPPPAAPLLCSIQDISASPGYEIPTGVPVTFTAQVNSSTACAGKVTWQETAGRGTLTSNGLTATFTSDVVGAYQVDATNVDEPIKIWDLYVRVTSAAGPCNVQDLSVSPGVEVRTGDTVTLTAQVNSSAACQGNLIWRELRGRGTLTPNGLTATFTADVPDLYNVSVRSSDEPSGGYGVGLLVRARVVPLACGQPNGTVITHAASIAANETWAGNGVTHRIPSSISITGNATVTIESCAIVELGPEATIAVQDNARLVSAGTSNTSFVVFRRADANLAWGTLRGYGPTSLIDLRFTRLQGGGAFGGQNDPTLAASGAGYGSLPAPVLRADNVTIESSKGIGVYLDTNAAFTSDSQMLTITGSTGRPVVATMMSLGSLPTGTYTGNGIDEILIHGPGADVFANMTVKDLGVPIRIPLGNMNIGPAPLAIAPVTLTLRPGVVFKFPKLGGQPSGAMTFGSGTLVGVLNAVGTAAKPIVFTSGEANPAPGDWIGIRLTKADGSRLDHVEINYAGAPNGINSNNCRLSGTEDQAALLIGDFSDQYVPPVDLMTNSRITHSAYYGINAMWQASSVSAPDLTATNTFENNARCRQTWNGLTPPLTCPIGGGCTAP